MGLSELWQLADAIGSPKPVTQHFSNVLEHRATSRSQIRLPREPEDLGPQELADGLKAHLLQLDEFTAQDTGLWLSTAFIPSAAATGANPRPSEGDRRAINASYKGTTAAAGRSTSVVAWRKLARPWVCAARNGWECAGFEIQVPDDTMLVMNAVTDWLGPFFAHRPRADDETVIHTLLYRR